MKATMELTLDGAVETLLKKHATPDAAQWRRYQVKKLVKVCGKLILKRR